MRVTLRVATTTARSAVERQLFLDNVVADLEGFRASDYRVGANVP